MRPLSSGTWASRTLFPIEPNETHWLRTIAGMDGRAAMAMWTFLVWKVTLAFLDCGSARPGATRPSSIPQLTVEHVLDT